MNSLLRFFPIGWVLVIVLLATPAFAEPGHVFPALTADELARISAAVPAQARVPVKQKRRLLVFYRTEGFVHASIPHANEALKQLGSKTGAFEAELSDDMTMFEPANLQRFDAVLFNNTTLLKFENPAHRQALRAFLQQGRGLIGLHAGTDNFPTWPEAQAWIGGVFHSHPWNSKDVVAVKLDEPAHPIVAAFAGQGFWVRDEIYQIAGPYSRDQQRVLLSLDMSKPQNQRPEAKFVRDDHDFPISWVKSAEGARVFYSSFGHNPDIYSTPEILQHYLDGIQFALGDLAVDALPSSQLKVIPTPALSPAHPQALQDRQVAQPRAPEVIRPKDAKAQRSKSRADGS